MSISAPEQLSIQSFLRDRTYRKFFTKAPYLPPSQRFSHMKPWRLYVQREEGGKWSRAELRKYHSAFEHVRALLKEGVHDLTINSKAVAYWPPTHKGGLVWDDYPRTHKWCPFCRRPVVYWWFSSHHALRGWESWEIAAHRRCSICGYREDDAYIHKFQQRGVRIYS